MVQVLIGDSYLIKQKLSSIIPKEIKNSIDYMEVTTFGINEITFLNSISFLGNIKKTMVYSTDNLATNEHLLMAANEESPDYELIITCSNIDKRCKLYSVLKKLNVITHLELNTKSAAQLIGAEIAKYDAVIPKHCVNYILKRCGFNDGVSVSGKDIANWCRLMTLTNKKITSDIIDLFVPECTSCTVWALKDALIKKESATVMEMADTLLNNGDSPIAILSAMVTDFRIAYKLSFFKTDKNQAVKEIGIKRIPFSCEKYTSAQLDNVLKLLINGIVMLKNGYNSNLLLKSVLAQVLQELNNM